MEAFLDFTNRATKYPSIATYHPINGGMLQAGSPNVIGLDDGPKLLVTEKVDGTNARVIITDRGTFIGSREELLTRIGDVVPSTSLGIVKALRGVAENWIANMPREPHGVTVIYCEVFGGKIGNNARHYTAADTDVFHRVLDVAMFTYEQWESLEQMTPETLSVWREADTDGSPMGSRWATEAQLMKWELDGMFMFAPRLDVVSIADVPTTVEETHKWLRANYGSSVASRASEAKPAEGIVLRTPSRKHIYKLRFADYMKYERKQIDSRRAMVRQEVVAQ